MGAGVRTYLYIHTRDCVSWCVNRCVNWCVRFYINYLIHNALSV